MKKRYVFRFFDEWSKEWAEVAVHAASLQDGLSRVRRLFAGVAARPDGSLQIFVRLDGEMESRLDEAAQSAPQTVGGREAC